jgi:hypothetical protein
MLGWYLDILLGYLIRSLVRFIRMRRSENWPVVNGVILSATCPPTHYGGPVAEFGYNYIRSGEYYSGVHRTPFMLRSSAEYYVNQIVVGAQIGVRIKPTQTSFSYC